MKRWALPIAATAFFAIVSAGIAPSAGAQEAKLSVQDKHFLLHAAADNMAEVRMGEVAAEKAESDSVKQFGQRMVTDHGKAGDQLKQIAQQKGVELPQELGQLHQRSLDELKQLSGSEFDQHYMAHQVIDHDMAVHLFERESQQGQDPDLKNFASQILPILQEHHEAALEISGQGLTAEQQ